LQQDSSDYASSELQLFTVSVDTGFCSGDVLWGIGVPI